MDNTFTNCDTGSTIYLGDEEDMLPKYHAENAIYLYCVLERETAIKIINTNVYLTPMILYETPLIAKIMAKKYNESCYIEDCSKFRSIQK